MDGCRNLTILGPASRATEYVQDVVKFRNFILEKWQVGGWAFTVVGERGNEAEKR